MISRILLFMCVIVLLASCARALTPYEAANLPHSGKCRNIR